jgi:S-DNA-T family DNA segregation ATPase FtsK/SpoIIIE
MATRSTRGRKSTSRKKKVTAEEGQIFSDISLLLLFALCVVLFLCNLGIISNGVAVVIRDVLFGVFGFMNYVLPIYIFFAFAFIFLNPGNKIAKRKVITVSALFVLISILADYLSKITRDSYSIVNIYTYCSENKSGGGLIAGSLAFALWKLLDTVGAVLVVVVLIVVCLIILTGKSISKGMREGKEAVSAYTKADEERRVNNAKERYSRMEDAKARRQAKREAKEEERRLMAERRRQLEEERASREEQEETEKILRMEKKVSGVMVNTSLTDAENYGESEDVHEITYSYDDDQAKDENPVPATTDFDKIRIHTGGQMNIYGEEEEGPEEEEEYDEIIPAAPQRPKSVIAPDLHEEDEEIIPAPKKKIKRAYRLPSINLLKKGKGSTGANTNDLKETAKLLQQTLANFGVHVTITDISQGPAVTRYEMQPEMGVKVSKILGLTDDIKLNLAATDIRIEAPIPGKAAIGIEVPNKENSAVSLRELLESKEYKNFNSKLAFAVGKDIAGKVVVADIAKMPHMLIAGATGSGKSVCINTLIMSILYKATPEEVKLIMIDPKVVELSVYNGIPHLLVPVVTDPKKAASALHWGVAEMTDRYKKFADAEVRDLASYNKYVESLQAEGSDAEKLPQIVIIVDELADLMMVAPGEVEEAICRLAQLARAAGIHLIIATQRPSVDVITGLIKANMPSRVAFAVSSGVDSRTILDMNGAERLLGKGDMLFYPQGYTKPARIQGAFVSDEEVKAVVESLKSQDYGSEEQSNEVLEQMKSMDSSGSAGGGASSSGSGLDELFAEAGRFIIDKDKGSIGMLQRAFRIGFNRAARIMDQLCDYGVVGEEEGTKPRKVLMTEAEFERLLDEDV